ncbi:MAG: hypothetical protein V1749_07170 [Candidatus Desantisbacteria bacterium]
MANFKDGSFNYKNSQVLFAGNFSLASAEGITGGAVGKFSSNSFGLFVYAGGLNMPIAPAIFLTKVGGGFFYKPTQSDIDAVVNIALTDFNGVVAKAAGNIKTPSPPSGNILFSAHLFAGVSVINKEILYWVQCWLGWNRTLITL